jgi:chromate transport protein ChrA
MYLAVLIILFLLRAVLDYYIVKQPSVWFDLIYIVALVVLGTSCLESKDSQSTLVGWISLIVAATWFAYGCFREFRKNTTRAQR